jgi:hypothetical protein
VARVNEFRLWLATFRRAWSVIRLRMAPSYPDCVDCGLPVTPAVMYTCVICTECSAARSVREPQRKAAIAHLAELRYTPLDDYGLESIMKSRAAIGMYGMGDPDGGYVPGSVIPVKVSTLGEIYKRIQSNAIGGGMHVGGSLKKNSKLE